MIEEKAVLLEQILYKETIERSKLEVVLNDLKQKQPLDKAISGQAQFKRKTNNQKRDTKGYNPSLIHNPTHYQTYNNTRGQSLLIEDISSMN